MSKDETVESRGFLSSAFLVAAVAVVLVLGMVLKSDPPRAVSSAGETGSPAQALPLGSAVTADLPPETPIEPLPSVASAESIAEPITATPADPPADPPVDPPADPLLARLVARAEDDCARLAKSRGRWTAQLLVACKPETVDRVLTTARGARGLYVLPAHVKDDACFRICYGTYATSKEAAQAADLPAVLRGKDKLGAVEIAKVLP